MGVANRRAVLAGLMGTGAMTMLQGCAATTTSAPSRTFFERIGRPIGLQTYTLGDEAGRDLGATFAELAAIGYRDLELPSLYGRSARDIRAAADRAGVAISSFHLPVSTRGPVAGLSLDSPAREIADSLGALGAMRAVVPIALFPENFRPSPGEDMQAAIGRAFAAAGLTVWQRTAALMNQKAAALKPSGIRLGYHNHNIEFAPIGSTTGWDIMMREWDAALIDLEIDVAWIAAAGLDPVAFLNRHRGRARQLHVKDVAPGHVTNYVLSLQTVPVGEGTLDWARILPAAHDAGVRHFYVEQEPPFALPRVEAIRRSYAFLSRLRA